MKFIKLIVLLMISFFILSFNVNADDSRYEPTIHIEFLENEANILIGFRGEELNDITNTIAFDTRYFDFVGFGPLEDFVIREEDSKDDGKWKILTYSLVSDNFYTNTNYAVLTLKLKSGFKKGDIYLYDFLGISAADLYKYRHNGFNLTIKNQKGELSYNKHNNTKWTKIEYNVFLYLPYVIAVICSLILIFIIYLIIPSGVKKEDRKNKINNKINTANNVIIGERKHSEVEEVVEELDDNKIETPVNNQIKSDNDEGLIRLSTVDFGERNEEDNNN